MDGENNKNKLIIERIFNAPREKVWEAWTNPQLMKKWWGPKTFTSPDVKIDLWVGGKYLNCMRSPDGKDFWSTGVYREIKKPEKLVMTDSFSDEKGNIVPAAFYGLSEGFPMEMLVTITLEEIEDPSSALRVKETKLTLKHSGIKDIRSLDRKNMEQGWNESLDKLEEFLKKSD